MTYIKIRTRAGSIQGFQQDSPPEYHLIKFVKDAATQSVTGTKAP